MDVAPPQPEVSDAFASLTLNPTSTTVAPQQEDPIFVIEQTITLSAQNVQSFLNSDTQPEGELRYLFHIVVPGFGGGIGCSDFTCVTIAAPGRCIVGIDHIPSITCPNDYTPRLLQHIQHARQIPGTERARSVLSVEAGTGMEASHIQAVVERQYPDMIMMNDFERKVGRKVSSETLIDDLILLEEYIKYHGLIFHPNWFCITRDDRSAIHWDLATQLFDYKRISEEVLLHKEDTMTSKVYSGKHPNNVIGNLVMALALALGSARDFFHSSQYVQYHS